MSEPLEARCTDARPFVTGSRAYGTPTTSSDVDLVVYVTPEDFAILAEVAGASKGSGGLPRSLRFGRLNLLCTESPAHLDAWRQGTDSLKASKPVDRTTAVKKFAELRKAAGITGI